jgi:hypothetical protein
MYKIFIRVCSINQQIISFLAIKNWHFYIHITSVAYNCHPIHYVSICWIAKFGTNLNSWCKNKREPLQYLKVLNKQAYCTISDICYYETVYE